MGGSPGPTVQAQTRGGAIFYHYDLKSACSECKCEWTGSVTAESELWVCGPVKKGSSFHQCGSTPQCPDGVWGEKLKLSVTCYTLFFIVHKTFDLGTFDACASIDSGKKSN